MASFSAGTTFTDGVANDVTAAKLGALVNNATPTSGLIQDRTTETIVGSNDTLLLGDASDSNNLKKMTVANVFKSELTGTINSTSGTITTATIPTLVATTLVTTGTGTAASPAIVPTGDTNTGIFFPAADTIAFSEGGTEAMRIDSSGNVGIGTASPATPLNISTSASSVVSETVRLENSSNSASNGNKITWRNAGQTTECAFISGIREGAATSFGVAIGTSPNFTSGGTNAVERLRIDSSGNVGIGTTSPSTKLHVDSGSVAQYGKFNSTAANGGYLTFESSSTVHGDIGTAAQVVSGGSASDFGINARGSRNLVLGTNNTERLRIDSSGNVGIGETSPAFTSGGGLHIKNATRAQLRLQDSTTNVFSEIGIADNATTSNFLINVDPTNIGSAGCYFAINTAGTERLRIDSSGRVGIGMTPASLLDISKSDNTGSVTDYPALRVTNTSSTQGNGTSTYNNARIDVKSGNGTVFGDFGTRYDSLYSGAFIGTESSHPVIFQTGGTERLRIDSSGFVSIGTATALSALHVHGNVTLSNTTTATSAGPGGLSKPATYAGYLTVSINGTSRKIPYYAT